MTILEDVLKDNKEFVDNFEGEEMSHHAAKKLAILTCMDCRLIDFFEPALGLKRGDAKIVRNAGNSIVGEDAIRSIGAALYNLGAEEVMVVGHTECGMAGADADALKEKMIARGIAEEDIAKYHRLLKTLSSSGFALGSKTSIGHGRFKIIGLSSENIDLADYRKNTAEFTKKITEFTGSCSVPLTIPKEMQPDYDAESLYITPDGWNFEISAKGSWRAGTGRRSASKAFFPV